MLGCQQHEGRAARPRLRARRERSVPLAGDDQGPGPPRRGKAVSDESRRAHGYGTVHDDDELVGRGEAHAPTQRRDGRVAQRHSGDEGSEDVAARSGDGEPQRRADRPRGADGEERRAQAEVRARRQQAAQLLPVVPLEGPLEAAAVGEGPGPGRSALELFLVRSDHREQARLEPDVDAAGLAAPRNCVQTPRRSPQRKQRDEQEIRDEFELKAHVDPTI